MAGGNPFERGLERRPANFQPLTPLGFLARAAEVHPRLVAIVHGSRRTDYATFYRRARRLASALAGRGLRPGDVVSTLLFNTPPMLESHFGAPMAGAVLNTLNTRLEAPVVAYCLDHAGSRMLVVDAELLPLAKEALAASAARPDLVVYRDPTLGSGGDGRAEGESSDYEDLLAEGDPEAGWRWPEDEWEAISLNYTSGTTGRPKGVVYHHRGAHLLAMGNLIAAGIRRHPVYLWTLPMFHCNGWCFPWTITLAAGVHVCLRKVRPRPIYDALADEGVTHMCGAPIVMSTLLGAAAEERRTFGRKVVFLTAAAPPPAATLAAMAEAGFEVVPLYGLTETYGPAAICEWQPAWEGLDPAARAAKTSRQGVRYQVLEGFAVRDPDTMEAVPADGETLGELMFRGNVVMKGYLGDPEATEKAFAGGWFHTGDLGVTHPDGYVQIRDRAKDIIISGGENISSIEIEDALYRHPAVSLAAVVAKPDGKWGEVPCAFVETAAGAEVGEEELVAWCRERLAGFKTPKRVVFAELPRTSTGKIRKHVLRERARDLD